MTRKRFFVIVLILVLALGAWYAFSPSRAPAPQPPLVTLNSQNLTSSFYGALQSDPHALRLVLLVSPT